LADERFKRGRKRQRIEFNKKPGRMLMQAELPSLRGRNQGSVVGDASTRTIQQK
jgi:hypothetical protein